MPGFLNSSSGWTRGTGACGGGLAFFLLLCLLKLGAETLFNQMLLDWSFLPGEISPSRSGKWDQRISWEVSTWQRWTVVFELELSHRQKVENHLCHDVGSHQTLPLINGALVLFLNFYLFIC